MARPDLLALRAPPELLRQLDELAQRLSAEAHGARITRSNAARVALERGLLALDGELGNDRPQLDTKAVRR